MKTAVLISGQLRTFKKCYPTQKWQIFRHYEPDIHFFVSCCDDDQAKDAELLVRDYGDNVRIESYKDPDDLPKIPIQSGFGAPYTNAIGHDKLMLQHWGNKRVLEFFWSRANIDEFDIIIRIRPDLWIHRFQRPRDPDANEAFCPWWGKFGGVNDRLAILGREAAQPYFMTYDAIPKLLEKGCPFHPETLVKESMAMAEWPIIVNSTLMTEFSTMRMDGSQRWAEIVMSDIAELIATR